MESVVRTRPEDVAVALLARGACKGFYDNLIPAARLGSLWVEGGDQTTGWHYACSIDYPADFPMEGKDVFNFVITYANKVARVGEICFRRFAELEREEELATWRPMLYEEIELLTQWLAHIPDVEELRVLETKVGFETWVIVNNASEETRYAIYDVEWELMRRFQDCVFDFHLIDRRGMNLSSLATFAEETLTVPIRRRYYAW